MVSKAKELGYHPKIIISGRDLNDSMPYHVFNMTLQSVNEQSLPLKGAEILILGVTYKANIDDIRTSPSEVLIKELIKWGADVSTFDPNIETASVFGVKNYHKMNEIPSKFTVIISMVDHKEFYDLTPSEILNFFRGQTRIIIDGKRMFNIELMQTHDIYVRALGRGNVKSIS